MVDDATTWRWLPIAWILPAAMLGLCSMPAHADTREHAPQFASNHTRCTGTIDVLLPGGKILKSVRGSATYNTARETLQNHQIDCSVMQIAANAVRGLKWLTLPGRKVEIRVRYTIAGVDPAGRQFMSLYGARHAQVDDLLSAGDATKSEGGVYRGPRSEMYAAIPKEVYATPRGEPFVVSCTPITYGRPPMGECRTSYYFSDDLFITYWFGYHDLDEREWPTLDRAVQAFISGMLRN